MPNFVIAYRGARSFKTEEEGAENYARYMDWTTGLADYIVTPDTPLMPGKIISNSSQTDSEAGNRFMGFTVIKAKDLEEAVRLAEPCPFVEIGTLEVHQMVDTTK